VDAQAEEFRKITGELLRREGNAFGWDPCLNGAADFIPGAGIQVEALGGEEPKD
jgi:hypothetical protein